jgi:uncharacterized membrane protein YraQ (UPF0718 family)
MKSKSDNKKNGILRDTYFLIAIIIITIILLFFYPQKTEPVISISWDYFLEMILILPAVMVIMGLFSVWVSDETIIKYLGKSSGLKGILLALFLGMLPTGPLYVAFPIAASLIKKGARVSNIIIFLSAWACIKLPQELVELEFLGFNFMITRLILTIIFVILMGLSIEFIIHRKNNSSEGKNIIPSN